MLFFINLMVTPPPTHTQTDKAKLRDAAEKRGNRGKKYGMPQNKNNRQKHKGKEPMEAQNYQEIKDKVAIEILIHQ